MKLIPIKVECHSGYKADEYPICFYWENIKFQIMEIADRWYQSKEAPDMPIADYFKVRTAGKSIYILKHELESDRWFLVSKKEAALRYSINLNNKVTCQQETFQPKKSHVFEFLRPHFILPEIITLQ